MNVDHVNQALLAGEVDRPGVLPRLDALATSPFVFEVEFGLSGLPAEPGVIVIRGARQYGKSTWLEGQIRETVRRFGPGSALFLDGDHIATTEDLAEHVRALSTAFKKTAKVRRLFIDEITSVPDWAKTLKRVLDRGELRDVLVVTTGSRAADLRHGTERLPGRKGRLQRSSYLFLPVSFREFERVAGSALGEDLLHAYLLSGGSPIACAELARSGTLPGWVIESVVDWILGECALSGRQRRSLLSVMAEIHRHGGTPLGQTKLAKEAGLANNTVAAGYIELLADLLCVGISPAWDPARKAELPRKPAKLPFINLLAAAAWSPDSPRSVSDFRGLPPERQAVWLEWLVAQELFRRAALEGKDDPERLPFWQGPARELDFAGPQGFFEVKRGRANPLDYAWFPRTFPKARLTVIAADSWETDHVRAVPIAEFLRGGY